jgi:hypothetical protein
VLLEDATDLAEWFVYLGRTVPATWSDEVQAAQVAAFADSAF